MAAELGASVKTAKRAALLHDLGKAVTHEVEGLARADLGAAMPTLRRVAGVVHAIEAHHYEVEPQTVEAVLADRRRRDLRRRGPARAARASRATSSGSRRSRSSPAHEAASRRCYALQAGREMRVMVKPEEIDDDAAALLSHEIAREIEDAARVPGPDQGDRDPRVARGESRSSSPPGRARPTALRPLRTSRRSAGVDAIAPVVKRL